MTQTFQGEEKQKEKKESIFFFKLRFLKDWSKEKQQKILFFFVSQHIFFLDFLNVWFFSFHLVGALTKNVL